MKALVLQEYNQPLVLQEVPKPVAGRGQVLVRVHASGVNPLDLKIQAGVATHARTQLPAILGVDLAGIVEAVGEGVSRFKPGDKVYGMTGGVAGIQGSLAEYAAVDADLLALQPTNLSMRQAAAVPLIFITAWEGLVDAARLQAGQTVLIHGGAGGVGHIAVQIAVGLGAKVYATVKQADFALIESYGATPIDYTREQPEDYVKTYTSGEGFDMILDTVGEETLAASFNIVKQYGHVVSILGRGTHNLAPLSFRSGSYSGVFTLYPLITGKNRKHHGEIMAEATALIEAGKLMPRLDEARYTMETVAEAYGSMKNRTAKGKVVVEVGS
jgi:NADPH:quinone reductase-like Zn-dependent oxidoreductase